MFACRRRHTARAPAGAVAALLGDAARPRVRSRSSPPRGWHMSSRSRRFGVTGLPSSHVSVPAITTVVALDQIHARFAWLGTRVVLLHRGAIGRAPVARHAVAVVAHLAQARIQAGCCRNRSDSFHRPCTPHPHRPAERRHPMRCRPPTRAGCRPWRRISRRHRSPPADRRPRPRQRRLHARRRTRPRSRPWPGPAPWQTHERDGALPTTAEARTLRPPGCVINLTLFSRAWARLLETGAIWAGHRSEDTRGAPAMSGHAGRRLAHRHTRGDTCRPGSRQVKSHVALVAAVLCSVLGCSGQKSTASQGGIERESRRERERDGRHGCRWPG